MRRRVYACIKKQNKGIYTLYKYHLSTFIEYLKHIAVA